MLWLLQLPAEEPVLFANKSLEAKDMDPKPSTLVLSQFLLLMFFIFCGLLVVALWVLNLAQIPIKKNIFQNLGLKTDWIDH